MQRVIDAASVLPGRCFVCERAFEQGENAWNTTFTYSPDWDSKLYGNKMVCDNCTHDLATTAGYEDALQVSQKVNELIGAHANELAAMQEMLDRALEEAAQVVDPEALARRIAELVKPKPTTRRTASAKS